MSAPLSRGDLRLIAFQIAEVKPAPTWAIIRAIEIETNFTLGLTSATGCVGLCQIDPTLCKNPGFNIPPCEDPTDPYQAVHYMCDFVYGMKKHFGDRLWGNSFLRYNVGAGAPLKSAAGPYQALAAYLNTF
jgi:hypothetical protein